MFSRRRLRFIATLVISGLILAYWGFQGEEYQPVSVDRDKTNDIDGFMINSETVQYNETGFEKQRIFADRIDHYPELDRSKIQQPKIHIYSEQSPEVIAISDKGEVGPEGKEVLLIDQVNITEQTKDGYIVTTDFLRIEPDNDYAETHTPVTLLQAKTRIDSVGMELYMDEDRIRLLQDVRGHHERQ